LDEGETNPIEMGIQPTLTFDIGYMNKIAYAVADDPFHQLLKGHKKYFPEVAIYDGNG
jgi:hypothetical protein